MHGRARVPALPPSGEIDNGRTEAALVSQSGNSNCHKSCLLKDGGRRPAFTGSDAADEWATSEVSRSGCPLADETLAQMSARAADRIWSQRGAGRFAGEKLEAAIGVEPMMEVLQTSALPLGYAAPAWASLTTIKGRQQSTSPLSSASPREGRLERVKGLEPVSYTHLTLLTIYSV